MNFSFKKPILETSGRLKLLRVMKLITILLFATCLQVSASGYGQNVTLKMDNVPLSKVLKEIKKQSGLNFLYNNNEINKAGKVSINVSNVSVTEALSKCLSTTGIGFNTIENIIVLKPNLPLPLVVDNSTADKLLLDIKGVVTDNNGMPLEGVSIQVKSSKIGTSTDASGTFSLNNLSENAKLVVSFIGYATQTIDIKSRSEIKIILIAEVKEQDEIVVVGYGSVKRKDLTGAVSSISGAELNKTPNSLFDAGLTGRAPGVHVIKSSGAPGAVASIRIRGGTSAVGTNEPLYVIDGVPIEIGDGFGNTAYETDSRYKLPALANINPADIESIDILKDASSAAIYGSRAANGVVLITTKKGSKSNNPMINFGYNNSFDKFANYDLNMLDANQYHEVVREAYTNAGATLPTDFIAYPNANTNWVDLTTKTAISNNIHLNISGGSKDGSSLYSFSGGVTDQEGVIKFTDFNRKNLRTNLETVLFKKLRFGTNINLSVTENNGNGTGQFYNILSYRPDIPLLDEKGNYGGSPDSVLSNPFARISQINNIKSQGILTSFFAEIEVLKGLKYRSTISSNTNIGKNLRFIPSTDVYEIKQRRKGSRTDYDNKSNSTIFDNTLTYDARFNSHVLNLLGGASFTKVKNDFSSITSINFQDDYVLNNLGSAGAIQTYSSGGAISGLTSYFLRSNYNYEGKYFATFTGRADHSTKFGPDNRWGFFPSGALAWKIKKENFMNSVRFVDDLKLRVSYGKTGSANFADFQYATFFGSGSFYTNYNGVIVNSIPNPDIRWESTYQLDAAVDFELFQNKLFGSIGYFQKITNDLILNRQIIRETGGSNQYANIGNFLNKGWELQLGSDLIKVKNFSYTTDLNITRYRSKVLKLNGGSYQGLKEGQPTGYFDGYKVAGIFQSQQEIDILNEASSTGVYQSFNTKPGDFKFLDVNKDGFIGDLDNTVIGKAEPDFYGGWNNIIRYKNFEMSAFFNFSFGNSLTNISRRNLLFFTQNNLNYSGDILQSWNAGNTSASLPRIVRGDPNNNRRDSDFFIEKASFFKFKNIQFSYLLNDAFLNKAYIKNIKFYASLTNIFTITKYSGLDPEVSADFSNNFNQGLDNNLYPQTRTITLGLNVNF